MTTPRPSFGHAARSHGVELRLYDGVGRGRVRSTRRGARASGMASWQHVLVEGGQFSRLAVITARYGVPRENLWANSDSDRSESKRYACALPYWSGFSLPRRRWPKPRFISKSHWKIRKPRRGRLGWRRPLNSGGGIWWCSSRRLPRLLNSTSCGRAARRCCSMCRRMRCWFRSRGVWTSAASGRPHAGPMDARVKLSPLIDGEMNDFVVEFHPDVNMNDARAMVLGLGLS